MNVVYVLLGLDSLSCGLAEHGPQFRGCLLPLGTTESFRANDEFAFGGDRDDQFGHGLLPRTEPGW